MMAKPFEASILDEKPMSREAFHKTYEGTTIRNYYEYLADWNISHGVHDICGWCDADNGRNGVCRGLLNECWNCGGN